MNEQNSNTVQKHGGKYRVICLLRIEALRNGVETLNYSRPVAQCPTM
ncbi:hypothetical protein SCACP_22620 [Sporomusa carbonis]